jgi:hypothetical protein
MFSSWSSFSMHAGSNTQTLRPYEDRWTSGDWSDTERPAKVAAVRRGAPGRLRAATLKRRWALRPSAS